jgi:hypothetical protein
MKRVAFVLALAISILSIHAQNNGIGIGTATPHPSAAFEVADSSRGILIPRMTMAQRNAIQNPAEGLMVYQLDSTKGFWYWDGLNWNRTSTKSTVDYLPRIGFTELKVISTPGVYTWTVPQGITKILVELWGGGGGKGGNGGGFRLYSTGGPIHSVGGIGGNGGQGGYNKGILSVSSGQNFSIKVGSGGAPGDTGAYGDNGVPGGTGATGESGGQSLFSNILAQCGAGGTGGTGGNNCCYNCACIYRC